MSEWNGVPVHPEQAGWHLLRVRVERYGYMHEGQEEAWRWHPEADGGYCWIRPLHGAFTPEQISDVMDYIAPMAIESEARRKTFAATPTIQNGLAGAGEADARRDEGLARSAAPELNTHQGE
jgi:hypothetical protein